MTDSTMDHPAAHSMDTTWFAVDSDGCVGVFDTGEAGALPMDAASGGGAGEPSFDRFFLDAVRVMRVLVAVESSDEKPDLDLEPLPAPPSNKEPPPRWTQPQRVVFALQASPSESAQGYRDPPKSTVESTLPAGSLLVLREHAPRVMAVTQPLEPARLTALAAHPDVAVVLGENEFYGLFEDGNARDGLFAYGHHEDEASQQLGPGAYRRAGVPAEPMRLAEIPASVRAAVGELVLPVRFAETPAIHLADYMTDDRATTWSSGPLRETTESRRARDERAKIEWRGRVRAARIAWTVIILGILLTIALGIWRRTR